MILIPIKQTNMSERNTKKHIKQSTFSKMKTTRQKTKNKDGMN